MNRKTCCVESLESRTLLSTALALTGVELRGPVTSVSAVVLHFSAPLNAATAQDVGVYSFGKMPANNSSGSGLTLGDFLPFRATSHAHAAVARPKAVRAGRIQFSSAVYDAAADTVTLTSVAPFKAQTYLRFLRVRGTGTHALQDDQGNLFNGGADKVVTWKVRTGKNIAYTDGSGNHLKFKVHGPGKLIIFFRHSKDPAPVIYVSGATSATSITADATHPNAVVPVVEIYEVVGAAGVANNLLNNPKFHVALSE